MGRHALKSALPNAQECVRWIEQLQALSDLLACRYEIREKEIAGKMLLPPVVDHVANQVRVRNVYRQMKCVGLESLDCFSLEESQVQETCCRQLVEEDAHCRPQDSASVIGVDLGKRSVPAGTELPSTVSSSTSTHEIAAKESSG